MRPEGEPTGGLRGRIESLTFCGDGDEAYEVFQQACSFCLKLAGLGLDDWAESVCRWAEEMTKASWESDGESCDLTEASHGQP